MELFSGTMATIIMSHVLASELANLSERGRKVQCNNSAVRHPTMSHLFSQIGI